MNKYLINYMDKVEVKLINKFFNINIDSLCCNNFDECYIIGKSNFENIINFYKFEPKQNELLFWNSIENILQKYNLKNQIITLQINKIKLPYIWYDYVTPIYFEFTILNDIVIFNFKIKFESLDIYSKILNIICIRQFLTDVCKDKKYNIILSLKKLNIMLNKLEGI